MKFTKTHEWIKIGKDAAIMGITHHAQQQLSDVVYIDFPEVGDSLELGESFMVIESVKSANDIYAPVSGEVIEINSMLSTSPEIVNESAEERGWLVKIKMSDPSQIENLLDKDDYSSLIKDRLAKD